MCCVSSTGLKSRTGLPVNLPSALVLWQKLWLGSRRTSRLVLFGRSLSVGATLATATAGGVLAFVVGIVEAYQAQGVGGWELIIAALAAFEYGTPFIGGLLFGNLVYLRQKNS